MIHLNIPAANLGDMFSWSRQEQEAILEKAVELAVRMGMSIEDDAEETYLRELRRAGARVNRQDRAALFSEKDIRETMSVLNSTSPAPKPSGKPGTARLPRKGAFGMSCGAQLLFDWDLWSARAVSRKDWIRLCHWAQGCDLFGSCGNPMPVQDRDLDPRIMPLYIYALTGKYCRKPYAFIPPTLPLHVRYTDPMARAMQQSRGYAAVGTGTSHMEYINSPFRVSTRTLATMLAGLDLGIWRTVGLGSMAVSGMNAPLSISGLVVLAIAEILSGLTLLRSLRPGTGLMTFAATGTTDVRTDRAHYGDIRSAYQNLAVVEIFRKTVGADCGCLTYYRDANEPGMQAMYELGLNAGFFSGVFGTSIPQVGSLSSSSAYSPEQAVLDMEAAKEVTRICYSFPFEKDSLCLDDILRVGYGKDIHLTSGYTLAHSAEEGSFSTAFPRGLSPASHHRRDLSQTQELLNQAHERVLRDTELGSRMDPDIALGNVLYEYVKEAAGEMNVGIPPLE